MHREFSVQHGEKDMLIPVSVYYSWSHMKVVGHRNEVAEIKL
jgi:hypothetical protein